MDQIVLLYHNEWHIHKLTHLRTPHTHGQSTRPLSRWLVSEKIIFCFHLIVCIKDHVTYVKWSKRRWKAKLPSHHFGLEFGFCIRYCFCFGVEWHSFTSGNWKQKEAPCHRARGSLANIIKTTLFLGICVFEYLCIHPGEMSTRFGAWDPDIFRCRFLSFQGIVYTLLGWYTMYHNNIDQDFFRPMPRMFQQDYFKADAVRCTGAPPPSPSPPPLP